MSRTVETAASPMPSQSLPSSASPASAEKTLSNDEEASLPAAEDDGPTEGGAKAWLTVLGSSCVAMNAFGTVNAFGAFNNFYRSTYETSSTPTVISLIGSLQVFLLYLGSGFIGPIFDAYGPRVLIPTSGFLATLSLVLLSLARPDSIYQVFLTQSVLFGLAATIGFAPSLAIVSHWFAKRNAWALGIVLGSASLGGLVYSLLYSKLLPKIGFGWSVRAQALMVACLYVVAALTIHPRRRTKPFPGFAHLLDFGAFGDVRFALFVAGTFLAVLGAFQPYFQIVTYGTLVLGDDSRVVPYLLTIMNAASIFGRIIPGHIADKVGRFNVITLATFLAGLLCILVWYNVTSEAGVVAFSAVYGFLSGPIFTLLAPCVAQISPLPKIGARVGMLFATLSFATLAGSPIGGALVRQATLDSFHHLIILSSITLLAASAVLLLARFQVERRLFAVV